MSRARLRVTMVLALSFVAGAGVASALATTQAAWTDDVYFEARATAGTWETGPFKCYSVDPNPALADAECVVTLTSWNWWSDGYQFVFNIDYPPGVVNPQPFKWEAEFDLSETGYPAPGPSFGTLFPGNPVPPRDGGTQWSLHWFSQFNLCTASTTGELPILRVRGGFAFDELVPAINMGVTAHRPTGGFELGTPGFPSCA